MEGEQRTRISTIKTNGSLMKIMMREKQRDLGLSFKVLERERERVWSTRDQLIIAMSYCVSGETKVRNG